MNLYKNLPPLEKTWNGKPYEIPPELRKRVNNLIIRECCNCENRCCMELEDYDTHTCPQLVSLTVCCKWFRWAVLPLDKALEAEIYKNIDMKRCAVCGLPYYSASHSSKYCTSCKKKVLKEQKKLYARKKRSMSNSKG